MTRDCETMADELKLSIDTEYTRIQRRKQPLVLERSIYARQQNSITCLHDVRTPFANQRMGTYTQAGSSNNGEPFRSTLWPIIHKAISSRSQSENGYRQIKGTVTLFRLCVLIYSVTRPGTLNELKRRLFRFCLLELWLTSKCCLDRSVNVGSRFRSNLKKVHGHDGNTARLARRSDEYRASELARSILVALSASRCVRRSRQDTRSTATWRGVKISARMWWMEGRPCHSSLSRPVTRARDRHRNSLDLCSMVASECALCSVVALTVNIFGTFYLPFLGELRDKRTENLPCRDRGTKSPSSDYKSATLPLTTNQICTAQRYGGNTARLALRSDEALGVRVSVAPSRLDLGRGRNENIARQFRALVALVHLMRVICSPYGSRSSWPRTRKIVPGKRGILAKIDGRDSRENSPTSGIVQYDSHLRKSGSDPAGD
ncbi:hypothetical protein PR048_014160 [Dryococelus australis]|uniref:Uncharacterized protein n=1 Tax=Dryococelus australis TaxID=614101 RepID=A0ABQ9HDH0_9NEOP|nr:hypothetical protein PR048_014160 [Dryococelus australis]